MAKGKVRERARRSTRVGGWAVLVLLSAVVLPPLSGPARAQQAGPAPSAAERLTQRLEDRTAGSATVRTDPASGLAHLVRTDPGSPIPRAAALAAGAPAPAVARGFLDEYGPLFGIIDPGQQLRRTPEGSAPGAGSATVRYQQVHRGVPVLGGELAVQLDGSGAVLGAVGEAAGGLTVDPSAEVGPADALAAALASAAKVHGAPAAELTGTAPELWIYDADLLGGPGLGRATPVWRTEVTGERPQPFRQLTLVDARTGSVALQLDELAHAKDRRVCNRDNVVNAPETCGAPPTRAEGQGPTGVPDVDLAYDFSGDTYDLYHAKFGRDSLDGAGLPLRSTVKYCPSPATCPYQNAYWNGAQMVLGDGYAAADDVVGHELTHGVTEWESRLFYYYQSGAINESLSDLFGELVDLGNGDGDDRESVRWLIGEDLPGVVALRDMADPAAFGDADRMQSPNYHVASTDAGGVHRNSGVGNKAASLLADGGSFNGRTVTALGTDKVARIHHKAQVDLLGSASDYADLHGALQLACSALRGTAGITAADCAEVKDAVDATEMHLPSGGSAATEAPTCTAGSVPVNRFFDDLENPSSWNWARTVATGAQTWAYPQNPNAFPGFDATYATSGTRNLFGADVSGVSDARIARTGDVVPQAGRATYLHFRHAYGLEEGFDGGVVEYSTNSGSSWVDAGPLFTHNGYPGSLSPQFGNPLAGRSAFTGQSRGYTSSRLDLTSLAGERVRFRFRLGTDSSVDEYGWFVDDVRVHTCNRPPTAGAGPDQEAARGTDFTLTGSGSDPDADPVSFAWSQVSGTAATIVSPSARVTRVRGVDADARLVFRVTVRDSNGLTATDTVEVKVGNPK